MSTNKEIHPLLEPNEYEDERRYSVVTQAKIILEMNARIKALESELAYYYPFKKKYDDLITDSLRHNGKMAHNMLILALSLGDDGAERLKNNMEILGLEHTKVE